MRHLAELALEARREGKPLQLKGQSISLRGDSTLAELVALFGYSTGKMRTDSLDRVLRQLERAGLEIKTRTGLWGREDRFVLRVALMEGEHAFPEGRGYPDSNRAVEPVQEALYVTVNIPDPFWPTALGLPQPRELEFLRALTLDDPILCVLLEPESSQATNWLQATWEGLVGWAYRSAQRFLWRDEHHTDSCPIQVGTAGLIHTYLRPTVLNEAAPRLFDKPRSLNLVTIKREADLPNDFERFNALWPGHVFEFRPEYDPNGQPTQDMRAINDCLYVISGNAPNPGLKDSPLRVLNWARKAYNQLMARPQVLWGEAISSKKIKNFKGSNEGSTALALKAHVAAWACKRDNNAEFRFEVNSYDFAVGPEEERILQRFDLFVNGLGQFEFESMSGSGPMESFYHRKIFSRIQATPGKPFWLVVPNAAVLWAGPFLADLAFRTAEKGRVVMPSADGQLLSIERRQLVAPSVETFDPTPISKSETPDSELTQAAITLNDLADMASVNELLVQTDRILGLGRLIVGTTNFIGSLDEALTRSGRFGRYIPIGPPDFEESVGIISYYLGKLTAQCGRGSRLRISVPEEPAIKSILIRLFEDRTTTQNRFCGADLEEAVNLAYLRCAKRAVPDGGLDHESEPLSVCLSLEELDQSLNEVPMSVTGNMMARFRNEIAKYCGRQATLSYASRRSQPIP